VLVEFGGEAETLVVLCNGLRLVPVGGYDGIVENLLLRLGLLANFGDAGAVLLLLDFATHDCGCCVVCGFVAKRSLRLLDDASFGTFLRERWRPG